MKKDTTTNILLSIIAIALVAIALRPLARPRNAQAQTQLPVTAGDPLFIEPGAQMLRSLDGTSQTFGRVVVDLQTGSIWGFPTLTDSPYPIDISTSKPPVSHPIFLGTFAFDEMYH